MIQNTEQANDWRSAWKVGLDEVSAEQIKNALTICTQKHDWPPSPAEFRALCIPPINYEKLFIDAANGNMVDKLTYWSAQSFGLNDIRRLSYRDAKERWVKIVDVMAAEHTLPRIPDTVPVLPPPGKTSSRDEAAKGLAAVKLALSTNPSRRWACQPKSQSAVDLMFRDPPMFDEIKIATEAGYIVGKTFIPQHKRAK